MTASLPVEIIPQLSQAQAVLERHLAGNLQAIHLFGSAVDGGLKPHSDIDLMVTVSNALTDPVRRSLMMDLLSVSAAVGADGPWRPLEVTLVVRSEVVPWRYPPLRELQFGEWLRAELQAGIIPPAVPDHDLAILLTKVRQHSVCVAGPPAAELFNPVPEADFSQALLDTVAQWNDEPDWQGDERNVVLALARIWFSAVTGEIAPKDVAAAWALERLPDEYRPVLAMARAAYLGGVEDGLAHRGTWVLRAARPGAAEFFSKLGFRTSPAAMERSRERPIPETRSSLGQQRRQAELEHRLTAMVAASDPLMAALRAVRSLQLRSWCIGAGAIRSLVWDTLHGFDHRSALNDMDVVYFDANAGPEHDAHLEKQLRLAMPNLCWEVTNQAGVHRWFADALGQVVAPLASLEEGVGTWPEFATCVGVYLNADGTLGVIAPHGLDDLFGLRVRHNPQRASAATYRERVQAKRFAERWPRLSIDAA
jgi:streptomycin 3"-adenylyltransferase